MEWNEIKAAYENEHLCLSLRGRMRFEYNNFANGTNAERFLFNKDAEPQDSHFCIYVDDKLFYKFDTRDYVRQFGPTHDHLRHFVQKTLSERYMSNNSALEASEEIENDFMPWLTCKKGIMRAEHAVLVMQQFINNPNYDLCFGNDFTLVLHLLSKYTSGEMLLESERGVKLAYAEKWFYPFIELRMEAERSFAQKQQ